MKQIVFTKYSAERSREFAIRTDIIKENKDVLAVEKRGLYPEGQAHIKNICKWYQLLQEEYTKEQFVVNRCEEIAQGVRLEYLKGETLQQRIEQLKEQQLETEIETYIEQYLKRMTDGNRWKNFQKTEEFSKVFGDVSLPQHLKCREVTNIDMIFSNILIDGETWHFIDYEWTFTFPIPVNFVLYRAFFLATNEIPGVKALDMSKMMERIGIKAEEQEIYQRMETHFQEYVRGAEKPLRDIIQDMGYPAIPMKEIESVFEKSTLPDISVQYYTNESLQGKLQNIEVQNIGSNVAKIILPVSENVQELEVQMAWGSCLLHVKQLVEVQDDNQKEIREVIGLNLNGMDLGNGLYVILAEKVWMKIPCERIKTLELTLQIENLQTDMNQMLVQQLNEIYGKKILAEQEKLHLEERYAGVEKSKLFRIYQKLKKFLY